MKNLLIIILISWIGYGCSVNYSFTGVSIGEAKTISIKTVTNTAPLTPPSYKQVFTEQLKNDFLQQTSLDLVRNQGDFEISGVITQYATSQSATTADQLASLTRLTVGVQIKFVNNLDHSQDFNKMFSWYGDYSADLSLNNVQDDLFPIIIAQISQNIIQDSIGNW